MYPHEKLLGLAIMAGIVGVVASGYLLAWRSNRAASRRAGSLLIAAIAGLVGLFGVWWAIGAVSPIPPPDGTSLWEVAVALLFLLPFPDLINIADFIQRFRDSRSGSERP